MAITERVGHMALRVPDLDASGRLPRDVLGLVETERVGPISYLTCNERHHELILIQQEGGARGYEHIGLQVADAEALERARSGIAAAGGELLGPTFDGEPGIDRAALVRGPGGHVFKLFCGMEGGQRSARGRSGREVRARLDQGPRRSAAASASSSRDSASASPTGSGAPPAGGTATPTITAWRSSSHPRHELSHYAWTAPDLNAMGRICDRLAARGRQADLGAESPRAGQQPLHLLP